MEELTAPYRLEYPYSGGSVGARGVWWPQSGLFAGRSQRRWSRVCPPTEYHPTTAEAMTELVLLNGEGTWRRSIGSMSRRRIIRSIGPSPLRVFGSTARTAFVHAVDTSGDRAAAAPGLRAPSRRTDRHGAISDIQCFVPIDERQIPDSEPLGHLDVAVIPVGIDYVIRAGATQSVSSDILSVGGSWVAARLSTGRS